MPAGLSGHVYRASLGRDALAALLAARFSAAAVGIVRRIDGAELLTFEPSEPAALPALWAEGQLFDGGAEVRWRAREDAYDVLLLTEQTDAPADFSELRESPFDVVIPSTRKEQGFMLWGTRRAGGGWYEARIPRLLTYPVEWKGKPRLAYRLYEREAVVRWVRLCGLKEEE